MMLFDAWIVLLLMCFGFLRSVQTEPVPVHVLKKKNVKMAAARFRKPDSSSQPKESLAAQFKKRDIHPMHAVLEKDSLKTSAQFKNIPNKHRQQSDDQIPGTTSKTPPQQQRLPLLKLLSNRTRDDVIFANLLQRCRGRGQPRGGQNGRQRDRSKCPQGAQWPRGELWKAWCLQSNQCIPKAVCHKLIKRIGGSDWDVCMDGINVAKGECLVYSVGVAGQSWSVISRQDCVL